MIETKKLFKIRYEDSYCYYYIVDDNITKALATAVTFQKDINPSPYPQYVTSIEECDFNVKLLYNEVNKTIVSNS